MDDKEINHIEIVIGRESEVVLTSDPPKVQKVLRFETFTSGVQSEVETSVGVIRNLEEIRTIQVRLLKVAREQIFR